MQHKAIVLARFWFVNGLDYKYRPSLIISNEAFNRAHAYFLMVPLTTQKTLPDFLVQVPENCFFETTHVTSFARVDQITPIDKDIVLKQIGTINGLLFDSILQKIKANF